MLFVQVLVMRFEKRIFLSTATMHGEEMEFVKEAFDRNWIAPLGFNCDGFEEEMQSFLTDGGQDEYHCLALASGTAALHLAIKLAGVKRGDVVFCTDTTFAATVNPVTYEGGVPVFIDSEKDSWNMDPAALEKAFKKYPDAKVVMLAHLYGSPAKMDEIPSQQKGIVSLFLSTWSFQTSETLRGGFLSPWPE